MLEHKPAAVFAQVLRRLSVVAVEPLMLILDRPVAVVP